MLSRIRTTGIYRIFIPSRTKRTEFYSISAPSRTKRTGIYRIFVPSRTGIYMMLGLQGLKVLEIVS